MRDHYKTQTWWKTGKLRFTGAPMFVSANVASTVVGTSAKSCLTAQTLVYATGGWSPGEFTTERNECFRAVSGGVIATSSQTWTFRLRWGTGTICTLTMGNSKTVKQKNCPYHVEFTGRITKVSSSGHITAKGWGVCRYQRVNGKTTWFSGGTTGSTGQYPRYGTSNINFLANTTLGLNISLESNTSGKAGDLKNHFRQTYGYIQWFK